MQISKITHASVWNNVVNNVCSFETSKKLWEADIKLVNSICSYISHKNGEFELIYFFPEFILNQAYEGRDITVKAYPAPSADDIEKFIIMSYKEHEIKVISHYSDGKVMIEYFSMHVLASYHKSKWYSNKAGCIAEIVLTLKNGDE